jgi:hypothetical protein
MRVFKMPYKRYTTDDWGMDLQRTAKLQNYYTINSMGAVAFQKLTVVHPQVMKCLVVYRIGSS